jgi:hypothetical protein
MIQWTAFSIYREELWRSEHELKISVTDLMAKEGGYLTSPATTAIITAHRKFPQSKLKDIRMYKRRISWSLNGGAGLVEASTKSSRSLRWFNLMLGWVPLFVCRWNGMQCRLYENSSAWVISSVYRWSMLQLLDSFYKQIKAKDMVQSPWEVLMTFDISINRSLWNRHDESPLIKPISFWETTIHITNDMSDYIDLMVRR